MKQKINITIDEEKVALINEILKEGLFRNRSHILEYALIKFLDQEKILDTSKIENFGRGEKIK